METRVRHINIKFADDPTDPAQIIARGAGENMDFWDFSAKKGFYYVIKWCNIFFALLND